MSRIGSFIISSDYSAPLWHRIRYVSSEQYQKEREEKEKEQRAGRLNYNA